MLRFAADGMDGARCLGSSLAERRVALLSDRAALGLAPYSVFMKTRKRERQGILHALSCFEFANHLHAIFVLSPFWGLLHEENDLLTR
jgi:hypothetical protein